MYSLSYSMDVKCKVFDFLPSRLCCIMLKRVVTVLESWILENLLRQHLSHWHTVPSSPIPPPLRTPTRTQTWDDLDDESFIISQVSVSDYDCAIVQGMRYFCHFISWTFLSVIRFPFFIKFFPSISSYRQILW